ncbi:ABC transporter permease [Streptomyces boluensis]|uniref:ABC transporter permease subunit n=1 Tax=Streptomyces boluensis TaxID=1775135 RepID=A0A964UKZ6_9ACTN|nr:iron ABC transporter permease [Streptomyces boluensis]NBE50562.1 ABC transporter permease subunit [Streptomyces boluensis]
MRLFNRSRLGIAALLALVGILYVLPIAMTVYGAFRTAPPGLPGDFSLTGLTDAFADSRTYSTLGNSLWLAVMAGLSATALAVAFAWIVSRTDAALRRLVTPLMAVVLATPPLFFSLAWNLLGTPKFGLLNEALGAVGLPDTLAVTGRWGVWFVLSLKLCSLGYFILIGPFLAMDRRLEEASLIAGAGRLKTFVHVNVPVMAPAVMSVFIIAFIIGLIVLDIPLIIGRPAGFQVFATQIFDFANNDIPPNYAAASALAMIFIAVVVALVAIKWRLLDRRQFTTVSGKGARPEPWDLGRWTWLCNAVIVVYALLALVLPVIQIVLGSLQPVFGINRFSADNFTALLDDPQVMPALINTAQYAVVGGALAVALSLLTAMVGRHGSLRLRRGLELSSWLPWAVQGIILGLALVWTFLSVPFLRSLFGTVTIVLIGLVVASTPVAGRAMDAALAQVGRELEESARVSGASSLRMGVGIVARLILPSCLAAWLITAIQIAGNFEVPILLSRPANQPVAVLVYQLNVQGEVTRAAALFVLLLGAVVCLALVLGAVAWLIRGRASSPKAPTARAATASVTPTVPSIPSRPALTNSGVE